VRLCGGNHRTVVAARIFAIDAHGGSVCVCGHAAAGAPPHAEEVLDHSSAWTSVSARRHVQARCVVHNDRMAAGPVSVIYTPLDPDDGGEAPPAAAGIVLEVSRDGAHPFNPICVDALDLLRSCLALYSTISARASAPAPAPVPPDALARDGRAALLDVDGGTALEVAKRAAAEARGEAEGLRAQLAEARRACRRLERAQQWLAGARCECLRARLAEFVHPEVRNPGAQQSAAKNTEGEDRKTEGERETERQSETETQRGEGLVQHIACAHCGFYKIRRGVMDHKIARHEVPRLSLNFKIRSGVMDRKIARHTVTRLSLGREGGTQ
jgi:hypothetical protein